MRFHLHFGLLLFLWTGSAARGAEEPRPGVVTVAGEEWQLKEVLGAGGVGTVYRGQTSQGNTAAVKIFSQNATDKRTGYNPESLLTLFRLIEDKSEGAKHILGVRQYGRGKYIDPKSNTSEERLIMVSELASPLSANIISDWCGGLCLEELLNGSDNSENLSRLTKLIKLLRVFVKQVALGLGHLGAIDLGYSDMKPSNVLIQGKEPMPTNLDKEKLVDGLISGEYWFALADSEAVVGNAKSLVIGHSPIYLPPEGIEYYFRQTQNALISSMYSLAISTLEKALNFSFKRLPNESDKAFVRRSQDELRDRLRLLPQHKGIRNLPTNVQTEFRDMLEFLTAASQPEFSDRRRDIALLLEKQQDAFIPKAILQRSVNDRELADWKEIARQANRCGWQEWFVNVMMNAKRAVFRH